MTKSIKLDDQVHKSLEEIQNRRETFSQAVARLIKFYREVSEIAWRHGMDHTSPPAPGGQGVTKP
jgi:predicted CopG family antitoxin